MPKKNIMDEVTADEVVTSLENGTNETSEDINKIVSSIDDISEKSENKIKPKMTSGQIPIDRLVTCRSICFGGLTYRSAKNGAKYRWPNMNSVEDLTFADLREMHNNKRAYLEKPLIIIEDENVVNYFRLNEVYRQVAQIDNLKDVLRENKSEMDRVLDVILNVGMRDVAISKIRHMRKQGILTNIDTIKYLESKLQFDLSEDDGKE